MFLYCSTSMWRYRLENKEPLRMNVKDTVISDKNNNQFYRHTGQYHVSDSGMIKQTWVLWLWHISHQRTASVELKSSLEYEININIFTLFKVDSVPRFQLFSVMNTYFFPFILDPEVTHRPSFSEKPSSLCLVGIQFKTSIF